MDQGIRDCRGIQKASVHISTETSWKATPLDRNSEGNRISMTARGLAETIQSPFATDWRPKFFPRCITCYRDPTVDCVIVQMHRDEAERIIMPLPQVQFDSYVAHCQDTALLNVPYSKCCSQKHGVSHWLGLRYLSEHINGVVADPLDVLFCRLRKRAE